jgi:glycerol-3-phosphate dehydrogenase
MQREKLIEEIKKNPEQVWDIIVIGGGATGLGIALDGASRGYKTLLLEQSDFAKGTSSRSTKLVHGGVRYLAQGDLFLVREALHERGLILKNASHLSSNLEFVIPVYSLWSAILYTIGLKFYDLLAGGLSLGRSHFLNRSKTLTRLPNIRLKGLLGGIVYHDGQFDDSRLALALAQNCMGKGGITLNYFRVNDFLKDDKQMINGVIARDLISENEYSIKAKLVVNATGVFADDIARMDNPAAKPSLKPSQGVHIVLDKSFLQSDSALMIPKTKDGRVLFAIPWYNEVVVGTTDSPVDSISLEPRAHEDEIDFILETAGSYLVKQPVRKDIQCVFAGLRPLAANPGKPSSTKEVSRRHKITFSPTGLLTIIGGKWTTYRLMAEETIDKAIKEGRLENRKCITADLKLTKHVRENSSKHYQIYGDGATEIEKMITENPDLGFPIHESLTYTKAEILWICRNEMPVNIEDILARRTRALFLNAHASAEMATDIAFIMAEEFGHSKEWQNQQCESYLQLAKNYI